MSLARSAQSVVRRFGLNVHGWPSERHIALDYRVSDSPRYGLKTGAHPGMLQHLEAARERMAATIAEIAANPDVTRGIPAESDGQPLNPYWNNTWFPALDACVLTQFVLKHRPAKYIEIGSGNSTIFMHRAKTVGGLGTTITSIDPQPRAGIDSLCDRIIRDGLEDADLALFEALEPGDILFFDGSHRVFQDSDVTVFFLEVLPRVKPGVLIHVHDIFWPKDYPESWGPRYYSEQYMLAMLFLYGADRFETLFASAYASETLRSEVAALTSGDPIYDVYGTSYWFKQRA